MITPSDFDAVDEAGLSVALPPVPVVRPASLRPTVEPVRQAGPSTPRIRRARAARTWGWLRQYWALILLAGLGIGGYVMANRQQPTYTYTPVPTASDDIKQPPPSVPPSPDDRQEATQSGDARVLMTFVGDEVNEIRQEDLSADDYLTEKDLSRVEIHSGDDPHWTIQLNLTDQAAEKLRGLRDRHIDTMFGVFIDGRQIIAERPATIVDSSVRFTATDADFANYFVERIGAVCPPCTP